MGKRFCENCGNLLGEVDLFCEKCGSKVSLEEENSSYSNKKNEKKYCIGCGNLLDYEDKFCQKCGKEVLDDQKLTSSFDDKDDDKDDKEEENDKNKKSKEKDSYEDKKVCLSCGETLSEDDRFCKKCGTEVVQYDNESNDFQDEDDKTMEPQEYALFCIVCGAPLNNGDRFCQKCGSEVIDDVDNNSSDEIKDDETTTNDKIDKDDKSNDEEKHDRKKKSKDKRKCLVCDADLDDGDKFCQKCGAEVVIQLNDTLDIDTTIEENDEKNTSKKDNNKNDKEDKRKTKEKKDKDENKELNKKECSNCGALLNQEDLFCEKCGSKVLVEASNIDKNKKDLEISSKKEKDKKNSKDDNSCNSKEKKKLCEVCHEELNDNDKFCQKCGAKVTILEEATLNQNNFDDSKDDDKVIIQENKDVKPIVEVKTKEKKSKAMTFGIILIIILLIIFAVLLYFVLQDKEKANSSDKKDDKDTEEKDDKDKPNDGDSPSDKDDKEDKEQNTPLKDIKLQSFTSGEIIDFYYSSGKYTTTKPRPNSSPMGKVSVQNKEFEIFDSFYRYDSNWKVIGAVTIYKDGDKIKIYDSSLNQGLILGIDNDYEMYKFILISGNTSSNTVNNIFGIEARKGIKYEKDQYGMEYLSNIDSTLLYDIRKDKKLFESHDYYDYKYINLKRVQAYQGYGDDKETILLNLITEEELMNIETNDLYQCGGMNFDGYGDNYITLGETDCVGGPGMVDLYTTDLKLVLKNISSSTLSLDGDYLFFRDNNVVHKYDNKGNEINRYKFNKVLDVIGHFFVVVENNSIVIKDEEDLSVTLGGWKDNYIYHSMISGYYDSNVLANENEKEAGIYLIIETGENGPSSGVEYYFNIDTHETKKYDLPQIGGYAKPVLYLYPEKDTNVEVSFENKDYLSTTYPKYKDSWKVLAKTNGDLYDEDGKYYYGLYWEEDLNHKVNFSSGFYLEKDNAIEFLEEKLTMLGFNDRERNEFIMYWLPILEKNGKSLVYFELTEERDSYNKLNITPKPDSLLRVAIHVKKVDKKVDIKEQNLPTFERVGFTAVEWGGVVYN